MKSPLILYHGTNERCLEKILAEGIKPRGPKSGNWKGLAQSCSDLVYLTTTYAAYYAYSSCKRKADGKSAIVRVELNHEKANLYPDEEFLWHALGMQKRSEKLRSEDTNEARDEIKRMWKNINPKYLGYADWWKKSLEYLGTVATDFVPVENITGYVLEDDDLDFVMNCDPSIGPLNFAVCGESYREHLNSLKWRDVK
jgi:hypothetical protein